MFESLRGENRIMPNTVCMRRAALTGEGKKMYDAMCLAVSRKQTQVTVAGQYEGDVSEVIQAIFLEQPFFYYLCKDGMKMSRSSEQTTVYWKFRMSDEEIEAYDRRIEKKLRQLRLPTDGSMLKREIYLHDIMQKIGIRAGDSDWTDHTIIGPLLLGHTVCEGMALLFHLLCVMCAIPSMLIIGSGAPRGRDEHHAWNLVRIDGKFVHVDVFWDALLQVKEFNGYCYDYFNLSDRNMSRDHGWQQKGYPKCMSEESSYFAHQKAVVHSHEEYRQYVRSCHDKGKCTVTARMNYAYRVEDCMKVIWEEYRDLNAETCTRRVNEKQKILEVRVNRKK